MGPRKPNVHSRLRSGRRRYGQHLQTDAENEPMHDGNVHSYGFNDKTDPQARRGQPGSPQTTTRDRNPDLGPRPPPRVFTYGPLGWMKDSYTIYLHAWGPAARARRQHSVRTTSAKSGGVVHFGPLGLSTTAVPSASCEACPRPNATSIAEIVFSMYFQEGRPRDATGDSDPDHLFHAPYVQLGALRVPPNR